MPIESPPRPAANPTPEDRPAEIGYEAFVDKRIRDTRLAVKTADLAASGVILLAGLMGLLLLAAIAEHWLIPGGFSDAERLGLFGVGALGAAVYAAGRLMPIVLRRVNPLYAAREIERDAPALKNSLVNVLQLREADVTSAAVKQTLERHAAERLATTGETAVDHTPLIRAAWVLLVLVGAIGLYVVASPKNFFATAGRVIMPWAEIAAPTRVRIENLEPGAAEVAQGERIEVTALVTGLDEGEPVELVFSTADKRFVDRRVTMRPSATGLQHSVTLPPGSGAELALGLQTDLEYRLEAGDARTPRYAVRVLSAPTIAPLSVRYEYPAYTGLGPREVEAIGDLRALEGTRVTLVAEANLPIDSAQLDLRADGRPDVRMRVDDRRATGRFTLRRAGEGAVNDKTSYVIRFTSVDGQANNSPPKYRLETIADLPPEAALLEPAQREIEVAVDQTVTIALEARDPDYALAKVQLIGETDGRRVLRRSLLNEEHQGRWFRRVNITPEKLGLQPGDRLDYWAEAIDNRSPEPNRADSTRRRLRIVGPSKNEGRPGQEGQDNPDGESQEGQPQDGQGQEGNPQEGEQGADSPDRQGNQQRPGENGQREGADPSNDGQPENQQGNEQSQQEKEQQEKEQQDAQEGPGREPPPGGLRGPGEESGQPGAQQESGGSGDSASDTSDGEDQSAGPSGGDRQSSDNPTDNQGDQQSAAEKGGDNDSSTTQEDESPVARDGGDDGSAFERILEYLKDQEGESGKQDPGKSEPSSSGNPQPGERDGANDPKPGADDTTGRPQDQNQPNPDRSPSGSEPQDGDQPGEQSDSTSSDPGGSAEPGQETEPNASPREGTGDSGQNQAADEGGGQAGDRGAGESSDRPGEQQESDRPTGRSGDKPGEGSSTRDREAQQGEQGTANDSRRGDSTRPGEQGESGDPSSDDPAGDPAGDASSEQANDSSGSSEGPSSNQQERGRPTRGAPPEGEGESNNSDPGRREEGDSRPGGPRGERREGDPSADPSEQDQPSGERSQGGNSRGESQRDGAAEDTPSTEKGGDEANLEYAKKQTELVLDRLEEKLAEREVDRSLLEKLGWSEEDLQRFVRRWRQRQQESAENGTTGEAELDQALRSLGLKPGGPKAQSRTTKDDLRDLRERSRVAVPPALRDSLKWYNRGVSSSGDDSADAPE